MADEENDPADFMFNHEEYQDWTVTVTDATLGSKEVFRVSSAHLVSHSAVFRKMMTDPNWVKSKNLEIHDITAEEFKMILRHVYGGDIPEMSRESAARLALVADMYMMPRLVRTACTFLLPLGVEDVFPALSCVSYISCPDLEPHVVKVIQENTGEVMESQEFLELDGKCLEFILKQESLSLREVDLWRNLVRWGEHQVTKNPGKILREVLQGALAFVRLQTLSQEEITQEVVPAKVLTRDESLDLLCAVINKQSWDQPGFCQLVSSRKLIGAGAIENGCANEMQSEIHVFQSLRSSPEPEVYKFAYNYKSCSFVITTYKNIELQSLRIRTKPISSLQAIYYSLNFDIAVKKCKPDFDCQDHSCLKIGGMVECKGDELATLTLKMCDGSFLDLRENWEYYFRVEISEEHAMYYTQVKSSPYSWKDTTQEVRTVEDVMTVKYQSSIFVQEIWYRILH